MSIFARAQARMTGARRRRRILRQLGASCLEVVEDVCAALSPSSPGGVAVTDAEAAIIVRSVGDELVESIWATLHRLGLVESSSIPEPPPGPPAVAA